MAVTQNQLTTEGGDQKLIQQSYAGIGEKANALEQAWQGVADYDNDALIKPLSETYRARVLAQLGDVDAAILALPHLLEMPGGVRPGNLRFSPYWDPLRKDPRFETLLKNPPLVGGSGTVGNRLGSAKDSE